MEWRRKKLKGKSDEMDNFSACDIRREKNGKQQDIIG